MRRLSSLFIVALLACAPLLAQEPAPPPPEPTPPPPASPPPPANPAPEIAVPQEPPNSSPEPATEAEEPRHYRFAIGAEYNFPGILSGPKLEDISSYAFRFSFAPSDQFMLTLAYTSMNGTLAANDVLSQVFQAEYNQQNPPVVFGDATFDSNSTVDIQQYTLSITKSVPIGGKWEAFIGIGVGFQAAQADVAWVGAQNHDGTPAFPTWQQSESGVFLTTVRGGIRYDITKWLNAQVSFELIPIDSLFSQDISMYSLNVGVQIRF